MEHSPPRCGNYNLKALFKKKLDQITSNQYLQAQLL